LDGRNLIFGHKLHIGTPYRGKRRGYHKWALAHKLSSSCLSFKSMTDLFSRMIKHKLSRVQTMT
jgi:hypothetical protein